MNKEADQEEIFPRAVFDGDHYTVLQYGSYVVEAPIAARFAALTYMRRDLSSACEMLDLCAEERDVESDSRKEEALWIAAIVTYTKSFGRNTARNGFNPEKEIIPTLSPNLQKLHKYMLRLRNNFAAHDGGMGAERAILMAFPLRPPRNTLEFGVSPGMSRIVSLGTDKAKQLQPLFKAVHETVVKEESSERASLLRLLLASNFSGVTLVGRYEKKDLEI